MKKTVPVINIIKIVWAIYFLATLSGCGRGDAYILPHQTWNKTEFVVEIRPGAPSVGMNEFVLIATQLDGAPAYNFIISIKTNLNDKLSQMIQDGHSGVYRRAIEIKDPAKEVLIVDIVDKKTTDLKTQLQFSLTQHL